MAQGPRALLGRHRGALHGGRTVRQKIANVYDFFDLDPSVLYRLAALPDEIAATLTPDTLLTDPRTGRTGPLKEIMNEHIDMQQVASNGMSLGALWTRWTFSAKDRLKLDDGSGKFSA